MSGQLSLPPWETRFFSPFCLRKNWNSDLCTHRAAQGAPHGPPRPPKGARAGRGLLSQSWGPLTPGKFPRGPLARQLALSPGHLLGAGNSDPHLLPGELPPEMEPQPHQGSGLGSEGTWEGGVGWQVVAERGTPEQGPAFGPSASLRLGTEEPSPGCRATSSTTDFLPCRGALAGGSLGTQTSCLWF